MMFKQVVIFSYESELVHENVKNVLEYEFGKKSEVGER